jgi:hypothetical protein
VLGCGDGSTRIGTCVPVFDGTTQGQSLVPHGVTLDLLYVLYDTSYMELQGPLGWGEEGHRTDRWGGGRGGGTLYNQKTRCLVSIIVSKFPFTLYFKC